MFWKLYMVVEKRDALNTSSNTFCITVVADGVLISVLNYHAVVSPSTPAQSVMFTFKRLKVFDIRYANKKKLSN